MATIPIALIFAPPVPEGDDTSPAALGSLDSSGFQTIRCESLPQLTRQARLHAPPDRCVLAVLAAEPAENCATADYLRTMHPDLGILAISNATDDTSLIRLLQSGVDNVCARDASSALVTTTLFRMLARTRQHLVAAPRTQPMEIPLKGRWSLSEQDWVINSPEGRSVSLTTGERAFLVTLLSAPEYRASHADLIAAINSAYDALPESNRRQSRLSVMVSRLRTKCHQHSVDLPLKSVHRWGYMFSGQL